MATFETQLVDRSKIDRDLIEVSRRELLEQGHRRHANHDAMSDDNDRFALVLESQAFNDGHDAVADIGERLAAFMGITQIAGDPPRFGFGVVTQPSSRL